MTMTQKLQTVLLLDDNPATNFIHKKFISKVDCAEQIVDFQSGINALDYLRSETVKAPELMFVDINMPIMDAWEFLGEFQKLENPNLKDTKVILLSTSMSVTDMEKANQITIISGVRLKPLTVKTVHEIIEEFFPSS